MKHVWVKRRTCSMTASVTKGSALPTFVTAMPEPRSMRLLPSVSTTTPPPAATAKTGIIVLTPEATAAVLRAMRACDSGPGIAVTRRRSCGREGPPERFSGAVTVMLMSASVGRGLEIAAVRSVQ